MIGELSRPDPLSQPSGAAPVLTRAALWVACLLLPVAMTVANKSSPLLLGLAAVLMNAAALGVIGGARLLRAHRDLVFGRSGLFVLAGIGLAGASLLWSTDPAMTMRGLREALPELVFAWSFAAAGRSVVRSRDVAVLRYGLVLASATILLEAAFGMPLHRLVGARAAPYDLKWSALTLALLLWPAVGIARRRGAWGWPVATVAAVVVAAVAAHSTTALCAVVASGVLVGLAVKAPRVTLWLVAAVLFMALVVPPWFGSLVSDVMPPRVRTLLEQQHAEHRIEIWTDFGRRIGERFWLGHGFNASFSVGRADDPAEAAIVERHPHNAALQVWVEFGLVGVIGLGAAMVHLVRRLQVLETGWRAVRLGQLGVVLVLALVWQNPWRPWWLAAIGLAMALFLIDRDVAKDQDGV